MEKELKNDFGKILIDEEVIAKTAGIAVMECYGLVGMSSRGMQDGLADLLGLDNISKGVGVEIEKDQTDSELAVDYCLDKALNEVFLIAALGGRIDQELANLNLLEYISSNQLKAKIIAKNIEIALITDSKKFKEKENYRLSLIPQTKTVENVSIQGCKYNLENKNLFRHKTRGISNLITEKEAEVSLQKGSLLYILEKLK